MQLEHGEFRQPVLTLLALIALLSGCQDDAVASDGETGECECASGPCCDGCNYHEEGTPCAFFAESEHFCEGPMCGGTVSVRHRDRLCAELDDECSGEYGPWTHESVLETCTTEQVCMAEQAQCFDDPACQCTNEFSVLEYECDSFSPADGQGPGGGVILRVCSQVSSDGNITLIVRKLDGDDQPFGDRPYQVRMSDPEGPACGPDTHYFPSVADNPTGIGTQTLTFVFPHVIDDEQIQSTWGYCVTASTTPNDRGYDDRPQQTAWWYSGKTVVHSTCN